MVQTQLIKGHIKGNGFTQADIARKLGIALSAFNRKINGKGQFTVEEASKICDMLKITDPSVRSGLFLQ